MNRLLMFWNLQKVAVKTFVRFSTEILMVLESIGGCCEAIINVLEYPEGCCEGICTFLQWTYQWFWNQQEAAVNHVTLHNHSFIYRTAVRIEIIVAAVGVMDWLYL